MTTTFTVPYLLSGAGNPEGVVTAPPGTLYVNTLGGLNQSLWTKVSGVGNIGWDRVVVINNSPVAGPDFGIVLIGQDVRDHGSNAGIQYTSTVANRAQLRANQYGAHNAGPGITGFKSRGPIGGPDVAVIDLDLLWRATAIGVCPNPGLSFPLAGTISIQVPTGGSVAPNPWVATEFEVALVALLGGANARRPVFKINSEGLPQLRETVGAGVGALGSPASGVATLDALGSAKVLNTNVKATTRIVLSPQDTGANPAVAGVVRPTARVVGTSFTIDSTLGAADKDVEVYWQLWEPITP